MIHILEKQQKIYVMIQMDQRNGKTKAAQEQARFMLSVADSKIIYQSSREC